jgi:hypothetical protein
MSKATQSKLRNSCSYTDQIMLINSIKTAWQSYASGLELDLSCRDLLALSGGIFAWTLSVPLSARMTVGGQATAAFCAVCVNTKQT